MFVRETIEINPIPQSILNTDLENKVCQALSLTGTTAILESNRQVQG